MTRASGVVVVLVAVGEERGPGRVGVCDEEWGLDAFVELECFGEPVFGVVVATGEVVEEPEVVTDRRVEGARGCDDLVVVWEQAFSQEWCSVDRSQRARGFGPEREADAPREVGGHRETCGCGLRRACVGLGRFRLHGRARRASARAVGVEGWGVGECLFHERDQLVQASLMETHVRELGRVDGHCVGLAGLDGPGQGGFGEPLIFGEIAAESRDPGLLEGEVPADGRVRYACCERFGTVEVLVDAGTVGSLDCSNDRVRCAPSTALRAHRGRRRSHTPRRSSAVRSASVDGWSIEMKGRWSAQARAARSPLARATATACSASASRFGKVDEEHAFGGGEREQPGPVGGRLVADTFEGPVDRGDAFMIDATDGAGVPAVVGEHGPYEEVDVVVLVGEAGGVEQGLAVGGDPGLALRVAQTDEQLGPLVGIGVVGAVEEFERLADTSAPLRRRELVERAVPGESGRSGSP